MSQTALIMIKIMWCLCKGKANYTSLEKRILGPAMVVRWKSVTTKATMYVDISGETSNSSQNQSECPALKK